MNIDFTYDELAALCRMMSVALLSGEIKRNEATESAHKKITDEIVKVAQSECSDVETIETQFATGERKISVLLGGKEVYNAVLEANSKEPVRLEDEVDAAIISVCGSIQKKDISAGVYIDTVKALAELVEARAKLNTKSTMSSGGDEQLYRRVREPYAKEFTYVPVK